jgi:glycosyltransferase involved in cell wall biosynthesis
MIDYSIIIPHRNIPELLRRCLNSIPRRKGIQIIVVDDNSDSDRMDFACFPGLSDPLVELIFDKSESGGKGPGYARNRGLEQAQGKWLIFIDADDLFTSNIEDILDRFKDDEHDIIYFGIENVDSDTLQPVVRRRYIMDTLMRAQESGDLNYLYNAPQVWGKLFRREIIENNGIRFSEVMCGEDILFTAKSITAAGDNVAMCLGLSLYVYTDRNDSLSKKGYISDEFIYKWVLPTEKEAVYYLRQLGKDHYRKEVILRKWESLYRGKRVLAVRLLSHVAELYGWKFALREIVKNRILDKLFSKNMHGATE